MELDEHGFFVPNIQSDQMGHLFSDSFNFNGYIDGNFIPNFSSSSPIENEFNNYYSNGGVSFLPFGDEFSNSTLPFSDEFSNSTLGFSDEFAAQQMTDSSSNALDTPPFLVEEEAPLLAPVFAVDNVEECPVFNVGIDLPERKIRGKKLNGTPSKNLMAERRRRKRLNDRLSMLRSIVPKITKMDRTSIVADTIDYVKELLEKINNLKQEMEVGMASNAANEFNTFKDTKASEFLIRNSPKFDVERRNGENTEIEICCSSKPGLLQSTVTTLEALGLEIHDCVISCFNDFALQASCSEELEQTKLQSCEDIKQALFRSAGYGGRCF